MYKVQLENMLVQHVYPEFKSSLGYLRARVNKSVLYIFIVTRNKFLVVHVYAFFLDCYRLIANLIVILNWTLPLGLFRTNFTIIFSYWLRLDDSLYKVPKAATISPLLISPNHPTHTWRDRPPHWELCPLLLSISAWVL